MSTIEIKDKRNELDTMAKTTITSLIEKRPTIQSQLDQSVAYGVANMKLTKVPIIGAGGGEGVLFVKQQHTYFTVKRFDIGGGWGARSYKALIIFKSQQVLDQWIDGKWLFEIGAEASAGSSSSEASASDSNKGFVIHVLPDGGAAATATARVIHIKVNQTLTNTHK